MLRTLKMSLSVVAPVRRGVAGGWGRRLRREMCHDKFIGPLRHDDVYCDGRTGRPAGSSAKVYLPGSCTDRGAAYMSAY